MFVQEMNEQRISVFQLKVFPNSSLKAVVSGHPTTTQSI